ncbi:MAG: hypothetical protein KDA83_00380 [Planctomycetales bacterium]|nr:hypothetical protein [Planctomycetales bacterium]
MPNQPAITEGALPDDRPMKAAMEPDSPDPGPVFGADVDPSEDWDRSVSSDATESQFDSIEPVSGEAE